MREKTPDQRIKECVGGIIRETRKKMKRIDRIGTMTVSEMAELIQESKYITEDNMGFCENKCECIEKMTQTFR